MLDILKIRSDTLIADNQIHFNNAGGALVPKRVTETITNYLVEEGQLGAYEAADKYAEKLDGFYQNLATQLGTETRNIAYATNATDAFFRGIGSIDWQKDDLILTTKSDYVSNHLLFMLLRKRFGVKLEILPEGPHGYDPNGLEARLKSNKQKPKLVSITHIPTNSGRVQDVYTAGHLCRTYEVLYAIDACQSAGQLPLNVSTLKCDFLSATFRKYLRGPRGVGFLYVSDRVLARDYVPLSLDLQGASWVAPDQFTPRADAKRFELWERNMGLMLGATAAVGYLNEVGINEIAQRIQSLSASLTTACDTIAGLEKHWTGEVSPSGIHMLSVPNWNAGPVALVKTLRDKGLRSSTSGVANDQFHFREQGIDWALRLSLHYYNTEEEIATAADILRATV